MIFPHKSKNSSYVIHMKIYFLKNIKLSRNLINILTYLFSICFLCYVLKIENDKLLFWRVGVIWLQLHCPPVEAALAAAWKVVWVFQHLFASALIWLLFASEPWMWTAGSMQGLGYGRARSWWSTKGVTHIGQDGGRGKFLTLSVHRDSKIIG